MASATAPDKGMFVRFPVGRRRLDGLADIGPTFEAAPFECERAQDLPPGFDEVLVGSADRLDDELAAGVGEREQQHFHRPVGAQVVQDRVHQHDLGRDPGIHLLQEVHPVGDGPPRVGRGEGRSRSGGRLERLKDVALLAAAAVDFLACPPDWTRRHPVFLSPLLAANSGSTGSPNHVSWLRQHKPSVSTTSPSRLRCMAMLRCSLR